MKEILVNSESNSYKVIIDSLESVEFVAFGDAFFIIDKNVYKLHNKKVDRFIKKFKGKKVKYLFEATEKNKSFNAINKMLTELLKNSFGRDALVVAIGGGITGDTAGFAASIYNRGIAYVNIPTTLLSASDSAIGGKTGVNFNGLKNHIGSFYNPKSVVIDTEFFSTLPADEVICGLGEISKYSYLTENDFNDYLIENFHSIVELDEEKIVSILEKCITMKASVVENDEKEGGIRKILNLGHTFGHAVESSLSYKLKHGQAVVIGMAAAFFLSHSLGYIPEKKLNAFLTLITRFRPYVKPIKVDYDKVISYMSKDKKNRNSKIKFVLPMDFGMTMIDMEASVKDVKDALSKAISLF
ncbi:MAG: 3-dehydroquinate synthase [Melioribacteraceae bacterium]|nr:3-dehydroquinate synthase [Melioribacteraceae bacterium]